jgi:transcriptional regulator with XRE-family HTH domain
MENFIDWLRYELNIRGWDQIELTKRGGISSGAVSKMLSEERRPGSDMCRAIAHALGIPQKEVFIRAGLMDAEPDYDPIAARLYHTIIELPPDKKQEVERYIQFIKQEKTETVHEAVSGLKKK